MRGCGVHFAIAVAGFSRRVLPLDFLAFLWPEVGNLFKRKQLLTTDYCRTDQSGL